MDGKLIYESQTTGTSIYRVRDVDNKFGGRTDALAIKNVLTSDPGQISMLLDEYLMSKHLVARKCNCVRAALELHTKQRNDGFHALYLEWAPGVTLREWIATMDNKVNAMTSESAYKIIVRLAWEVARSLSEIHDAGVIHNNISCDNIIVDDVGDENGGTARFTVKIIDFGSASLLSEKDPSMSLPTIVNWKHSDLLSLGVVLYQLFSGVNPFNGDDRTDNEGGPSSASGEMDEMRGTSRPTKTTRVGTMGPVTPLNELEGCILPLGQVPLSVSVVVSALLDSEAVSDRYKSAGEVEEDLRQMIDDPHRFLFDMDPEQITGQLDFPAGRLYGRDREVATLMESYNRVILSGSRSEMVLVSGYSGTGKSALVQQVKGPLAKRGGQFLCGKFDQLLRDEPLSAIVSAFTGYCEHVMKQDATKLEKIKAAIHDKVGTDDSVLTDAIPSLRQLLGGNDDVAVRGDVQNATAVQVGGIEAQNRFRIIFRAFAKAIASKATPVVLFLDDLQWADAPSLELIRSLVTDAESKWLLFVGCYRENEVNAAHPLALQLREIKKQSTPLIEVKLDNITEKDMNDLISDTLRVSRRLVRPLTGMVHRKTGGNPFFVIQFLKSLCDEGLLHFFWEARRWRWHTNAIESKMIGSNAVDLMKAKMMRLSEGVRDALAVASCLGSSCEESTLHLIENDLSLTQKLDIAVNEGLMVKRGVRYKFAHDQIQFAAYSLIPRSERSTLHCRIGNSIRQQASETKLEELLFVTVDQLNHGVEFIGDEDSDIELSKLNLRAGKKAILLSSFLPAAKYLVAGIQLLGPGHWEDNYCLSLELYELCAETEYCNANFGLMMQLVKQIFDNARCYEDKLHAYSIFINALGAQEKVQEAIKTGFTVLENLGEAFPDSVNDEIVLDDMDITKDMLDGYTDDQLVTLKLMEDEQKIAAMRLLYQMVWYTYASKPELLPLVTFRLMQLSLCYGVCEISAFGFALYGLILCGSFNEIERGYQFGQFALSLLDRFESKACLARVYAVVFGCVNNWKDHIRLSLKHNLYAYQIGMRSGDIEFAVLNAQIYCVYAFQSGNHLAQLEEEIRAFCEQMREYKQDTILTVALPFRQAVLNLIGHSENPVQLTGEAMNQEEMLNNAIETGNTCCLCNMHFLNLWLAYVYGDYNTAAEFADKSRDIDKLLYSKFEICNHAFFDGLTCLALARRTHEGKWRTRAGMAIEKMKKWAAHSPCNCQHKLVLMEAEHEFMAGDVVKAASLYDLAISGACENRFVHEQALACERAAMFYAATGDTPKASHYYDQAHSCYLEWGARDKASHVRSRSLSLLLSPSHN